MIFLKKLLLATVKFGPPIFTSVVLTKHGNTGYVLLCVCESPHRHQKNDIEKNENDNEKILSNVKNFPQKNSGSGRNRTCEACAGYALRYHSSLLQREIHFPVSTISTTEPENILKNEN